MFLFFCTSLQILSVLGTMDIIYLFWDTLIVVTVVIFLYVLIKYFNWVYKFISSFLSVYSVLVYQWMYLCYNWNSVNRKWFNILPSTKYRFIITVSIIPLIKVYRIFLVFDSKANELYRETMIDTIQLLQERLSLLSFHFQRILNPL